MVCQERANKYTDTALNILPNGLDAFGRSERRIADRPILIADAGDYRAYISASHRDDHICCAHRVIGQRLREAFLSLVLAVDLGK
ncbi:hypothetical protein H490_0100250 [Leucobacter sp. UCD-THU]|nr:hypothetical protein H490_0100250 [Leucobacter sp. UCD-THU]